MQKPHPPIWIAAVGSLDSFVWAGSHGYYLMIVPFAQESERPKSFVEAYRKAWREAGFPLGAERVQLALFCYVAETHAEAVRGFDQPARRYIEVFSEAVSSWSTTRSAQYAGYEKLVASIGSLTPEKIIEGRVGYVGTPEEVVEQIQWHRDFFGDIEPSMQINFGGSATRQPSARWSCSPARSCPGSSASGISRRRRGATDWRRCSAIPGRRPGRSARAE